jgi:hypothetical protein
MSADTRVAAALHSTIRAIVVPQISLDAIHRKASHPRLSVPGAFPYLRVAFAAAALLAIAMLTFPANSSALIQGIEARYRAALQALGGVAGPPVPDALISTLRSQSALATLRAARSRVHFALTPPAGLPSDVVGRTIRTGPSGLYSSSTGGWSVGQPSVWFSYRRADGRSFELHAERYDPKAPLTGKYMFEALDEGSDGRPRIVRHRNVAWRNGDQITTVVAQGISLAEIETIRRAMHGLVLPQREPHAPGRGATSKVYVLP